MNNKKTIDALNTLVKINNDRIEGYEKASANTEERELQRLFSEFKQTSQKCRQELIREINKFGGEVSEGTKTSGKFFRAWMDVKSALSGKDRKAILESCAYGEEQADETYKTVLDDQSEHLNPEQQAMISEQHNLLMVDRGKIMSMQNTVLQ